MRLERSTLTHVERDRLTTLLVEQSCYRQQLLLDCLRRSGARLQEQHGYETFRDHLLHVLAKYRECSLKTDGTQSIYLSIERMVPVLLRELGMRRGVSLPTHFDVLKVSEALLSRLRQVADMINAEVQTYFRIKPGEWFQRPVTLAGHTFDIVIDAAGAVQRFYATLPRSERSSVPTLQRQSAGPAIAYPACVS